MLVQGFPADRQSLRSHRYRSMMRAGMQVAPIFQEHDGVIGFAKLAGAFDDRLENRSDIGRRGCDHAENIGASGLID